MYLLRCGSPPSMEGIRAEKKENVTDGKKLDKQGCKLDILNGVSHRLACSVCKLIHFCLKSSPVITGTDSKNSQSLEEEGSFTVLSKHTQK